ncbi:S-methyl-5-thioribose kinase [Jeotgalibacillus sp. R-1-5s-1]|uniref:S-methyl-5-thioribose kinase n=1 Tax=Jeotgalibacillus sp. R-1-5s-1 TaxID=2555897 RepID=UPI00106A1DAC|nr:S-methyl-5-thioribose kinase [Jeotgalibacillus sp. R-1-5s-1]TFD99969.1 S-methyl-5-thioribose kinase [Jeotgalibacillus sp. R-1-5s-1]
MTVLQEKTYQPFTEESVLVYLEHKGLIKDRKEADCKEVGDGNLNYVFIVRDNTTDRSIVVKQALPYAKVVGESWPLSLDRARIERQALQEAAKHVPHLVPEVYDYDDIFAITVMEDLSDYVILRKGLIEGNRYVNLAEHIGRYLAETLFHSSDEALGPVEKKKLARQFVNPDLCDITEKLVFTDPYFDAESNSYPDNLQESVNGLWQDNVLLFEVAKLKKQFLTEGEALLHGDLHTGSVFVTSDQTKVIDPEFAFFGPAGFDAGAFLANLTLNFIAQQERSSEGDRQEISAYLLEAIEQTWAVFEQRYRELLKEHAVEERYKSDEYADFIVKKIWQDTLGFAGCKTIRRIIGLAHVEDIDGIEDEQERLRAQKRAIETGRHLIFNRQQWQSPSDWTAYLKELVES